LSVEGISIGGKRRKQLKDPTEYEFQLYWDILDGVAMWPPTEGEDQSTCASYLNPRLAPLKRYKTEDENNLRA